MECKRINSRNRNLVNAFIKQHWNTTTMIICGKEIDMTKTEGFYFSEGENGNAYRGRNDIFNKGYCF